MFDREPGGVFWNDERDRERLRQGSASRARVEMAEAGHNDPDAAVAENYVWVGDTLQERGR